MLVFDTLLYSNKLQAVGYTAEQAKVQAETFKEIIESNLATKQDIKELELKSESKFKELELKMIESKNETIKWVTGLLLAQTGLLIGGLFLIIRYLLGH